MPYIATAVTEGARASRPQRSELDFCPKAIIDHAALRHNLDQVRAAAPHSRIWGVIKADAYGHGAIAIAQSLTTDGLAVARLDEARQLRHSGEQRPLLIMGGVYTQTALAEAISLKCEIAVHNTDQAAMLLAHIPSALPSRIWLKVNTGMNRLGLSPDEVGHWLQQLAPHCAAPHTCLGIMTHLANADNLADPCTNIQYQNLLTIPGVQNYPLNIGNSAGILGWPATRSDWVRPGIMLYGISPFNRVERTPPPCPLPLTGEGGGKLPSCQGGIEGGIRLTPSNDPKGSSYCHSPLSARFIYWLRWHLFL